MKRMPLIHLADDCADSAACLFHGRCNTAIHGQCVARSADDCRRSTRCRSEGACHRHGDGGVAGEGSERAAD